MGIMCAYNDYDGIPIEGSSYWLGERLRGEMGFRGYVVSDSDAVEYLYTKHDTAADMKEAVYQSVMAGLNVRCTFRSPDSYVLPLRELVVEGRIPMEVIDSRVAVCSVDNDCVNACFNKRFSSLEAVASHANTGSYRKPVNRRLRNGDLRHTYH